MFRSVFAIILACAAVRGLAFDLNAKKAFVCDLDGTLFVGERPIAPAVDYVIANTKSGRFRFYYLTNNTSKRPQDYMQKLLKAGIPVTPEQVLTPLVTLESYIRSKGYASVYLLASRTVTDYLAERLSDIGTHFEYAPERNELIALTFDRELTYEKLANASRLWNMRNGGNAATGLKVVKGKGPIDYVMTHPDGFCPSEEGPIPDIGAMAKLLEATNGMKPSQVFGKPSPSLLAPVLAKFRPEEIAVVGDRLYTDKAIADNAKVDFVCVLSGETTAESLKTYAGTAPAAVVETFDKIERLPTLKVGFSRVDITPPLGSYMPGYYKDRFAKKVLDPLQINCVAFSDGSEAALVMQVDTEEMSDRVADLIRNAVVDATKVKRDAVLLHATHTHDGGCLIMIGADDDTSGDEIVCKTSEIDYAYVRMVARRAADAALNALADLKPAKLSMARSVAKRISFGRRYLMKDGKVRTNPGTGNPDAVRAVGTPPDEEVQLLRIDREGGKPIALVNFQTHPDVVGGETLTADWPGLTRTVFEAATFGQSHAIVINGTQGDVNHCNVMPRPGEMNGLKMDFDSVERGYDHAKHMANVLAASALSVWMKCVPLEGGPLRVGTRTVRVPSHRARDDEEKNVAWAERIWALHMAGKDADISKELGCTGMDLTTEVARAGRIRRLAKGPAFYDVPLYGFSVGRALAFGGFPGEPFNDIGKAVKKGSPFKLTVLSCLTNGSKGYFPFSDTFKEDGYEAATSPFGPTVADDLIAGELQLLHDLAGR